MLNCFAWTPGCFVWVKYSRSLPVVRDNFSGLSAFQHRGLLWLIFAERQAVDLYGVLWRRKSPGGPNLSNKSEIRIQPLWNCRTFITLRVLWVRSRLHSCVGKHSRASHTSTPCIHPGHIEYYNIMKIQPLGDGSINLSLAECIGISREQIFSWQKMRMSSWQILESLLR